MPDRIYVQHRFTEKRAGYSEYSDAIVLPIDEYEKLTKEDIDAIKEERFQNWKSIIENPPVEIELKDVPKEDLQSQVESIDRQIQDLENQKTRVVEAISVAKPKPIIEKIVDAIKEL